MGMVLLLLHIAVCIVLSMVVLLQSGKAADLAGAFGGGGSQTALGSRGAATDPLYGSHRRVVDSRTSQKSRPGVPRTRESRRMGSVPAAAGSGPECSGSLQPGDSASWRLFAGSLRSRAADYSLRVTVKARRSRKSVNG